MEYALTAAIFAALILYIASPFWRGVRPVAAPAAFDALRDERETLRRELRDLEFDRRMGKIDEVDFQRLTEATRERASRVEAALGGAAFDGSGWVSLEIEAEVLIARARLSLQNAASGGKGAKGGKAAKKATAGWQCAACGRQVSETDRFCGNCGARKAAKA